ncbi:B12-binding domain-containing radical SAM protein, partial [bacterium]|nr:B12-binding domain-containing radical SAM protein [bacterium]
MVNGPWSMVYGLDQMWSQILKHRKILEQETGYIKKDWGGKISVALVFPNTYRVGMGNLAIHTIYKILNDNPGIVCERAFLPEKNEKTLLSLESQRPLTDFDVVAFSISFQNDFLNILPILDLAKIEHRRSKRGAVQPLLIAGGAAVTMNPKPLAEIFDVCLLGEAEALLPEIISICHSRKSGNPARNKMLDPRLRGDDKQICGDDCLIYHKHFVKDLNKYPTQTVIYSQQAEFGDMHLMELSRGCPRKCKYCATPNLYAPFRVRNLQCISEMIEQGLKFRKKFGLISGDLIAHRDFFAIAQLILKKGGAFSPSSLRVEAIAENVVKLLAETGQKSISLGIEAAREELRASLGKKFSNQRLLETINLLNKVGLKNLRLYFMIGLPGETSADIEAIATLSKQIKKITRGSSLTLTIAHFVPKPGTPFAKEKFAGEKYLKAADKT